jgi:hypothetical protein
VISLVAIASLLVSVLSEEDVSPVVVKRRLDILAQAGARLYKFSELPPEARLAITTYFGDKQDPESLWISGEVSTVVMKMEVMEISGFKDRYESFETYHQWYLQQGEVPEYPDKGRWPSIMLVDYEEPIFDGFHRFHSYVRSGATTVPIVAPAPKWIVP